MDLLEKILNCKPDELDVIIKSAINRANENSEKIEQLGFINSSTSKTVFKGFIPLSARIKYSSLGLEDYSMKTTDFIYEFASFIRAKNLNTKGSLVMGIETFINNYFGIPKSSIDQRSEVFNTLAWQSTETDEEYFEFLQKNEIGNLKGKGIALCTERSAIAEQLLSLFDFESYYVIGCVNISGKVEAHCFNLVKREKDYALLDYSMPVTSFNKDGSVYSFLPFIGLLTEEEFKAFINNQSMMEFEGYKYTDINKKQFTDCKRAYAVGTFTMSDEVDIINSNKR